MEENEFAIMVDINAPINHKMVEKF